MICADVVGPLWDKDSWISKESNWQFASAPENKKSPASVPGTCDIGLWHSRRQPMQLQCVKSTESVADSARDGRSCQPHNLAGAPPISADWSAGSCLKTGIIGLNISDTYRLPVLS